MAKDRDSSRHPRRGGACEDASPLAAGPAAGRNATRAESHRILRCPVHEPDTLRPAEPVAERRIQRACRLALAARIESLRAPERPQPSHVHGEVRALPGPPATFVSVRFLPVEHGSQVRTRGVTDNAGLVGTAELPHRLIRSRVLVCEGACEPSIADRHIAPLQGSESRNVVKGKARLRPVAERHGNARLSRIDRWIVAVIARPFTRPCRSFRRLVLRRGWGEMRSPDIAIQREPGAQTIALVLDAQRDAANGGPSSKRRCERHLDVSPASVCPGVGPGTPDFRVGAPCSEGLAGRVQGNGNGFTGCQIAGHSRPQLHSVREMYFDSDLAQRNAGRVLHGAYEGLGSSVIPQNEAGTGTHHVVGLARPVLGSGFFPIAL